jgi:cold shock CspA family protein
MKGTVKHWNSKGYGFIKSDEVDHDVFVHVTALPASSPNLNVGDKVEFELVTSPAGSQAVNVNVLRNDPSNL